MVPGVAGRLVARFSGGIQEAKRLLEALAEDRSVPEDVRITRIITATSLICGVVAAQPIPFADIFILTPIQVVMVGCLAQAMGIPLSQDGARSLLTTIVGVAGWGVLAQHGIIALYKIGLPALGALTTVPLVYVATYAIGCAAKALLEAKRRGGTLTKEEIDRIRKSAFEEAKKIGSQLSLESMKQQIEDMKRLANSYKAQMEDLRKQIDLLSNRPLTNRDIRDWFYRAFDVAQNEVDIMCPWVGPRVANEVKPSIEAALRRNVTVKILYGIHDQGPSSRRPVGADRSAIDTMRSWFRRYGSLFKAQDFAEIHNPHGTHAKLLLCDEQFYIVGSFNFLSYDGAYEDGGRDELAELSRDPTLLAKYRRDYFSF